MGVAALITWFCAVLAGLYMLTVWLIENDVTGRDAPPSQLPVPVIFSHLSLAIAGFGVWVAYLVLDRDYLAWAAFALLAMIILLGLTMFARWIPVYQDPAPLSTPQLPAGMPAIPAEGNFPIAVVAMHGLLAGVTVVLVLLTALGVGAS